MEALGDGYEAFVERMQMDIASSSTSCTNFSSDVNRMPEAPPRRGTHRRAQSETAFQLPDDLLFEEAPTPLDEMGDDLLSMYLDMDYLGTTTSGSSRGGNDDTLAYPGSGHHSRSLSMDGMLGVGVGFDNVVGGKEAMGRRGSFDAPRPRHQHSYSMDGLTSFNESSESFESKKASAAKKLAELALVDPKRAKRILANRLSAARSKERKMRYISELERKVQTLQTEATTLSAQLTLLQRDTNALTSENSELRLRLQALEQQAQLRDALNVALKEDVQRLKLASGQLSGRSNPAFNHGTHQHVPPKPQYPHNNFPHPEFTLSDSFGFQVKSGSFANSSVKSESSSGSVNPNNGS